MMTAHALTEAERFLHSVLKRENFVPAKGASVIDRIFDDLPKSNVTDQTKADAVVWQGLSLLQNIHWMMLVDNKKAEEILSTPALRKIIDALLDLLSLEGIYPRLLPGVGAPIERRVRSVLQGGTTIAEVKDQNEPHTTNLDVLVEALYTILQDHRGIAIAIEQRTLVDVLAAMAQLAYSPQSSQPDTWSTKLQCLINSLSPTILFPSLISLLHSTTPTWLKTHVTIPLSLLPMRSEGVRQTITFVAKSTPQRPTQDVDTSRGVDKGPTLSLEVLNQVSKVLSSVPSTVSAEEYFTNIASQLYSLLEDQDPDARRAAAFTISHGILSKKQFGHPTAVGWKLFAQPLLMAISQSMTGVTDQRASQLETGHALRTLSTMLLEFPNPGLSKRLLSPIVLPLWAIACSSGPGTVEKDQAESLLKLYIRTVAGSECLHLIADNLLYEQDANRLPRSSEVDYISIIDRVARRCSIFTDLVEAYDIDREVGDFFASALKKSLQHPSTGLDGSISLDDAVRKTVYSHIAQEMITKMSSRITADASSSLSLILEVLRSQIAVVQLNPRKRMARVTRSSLAAIVQNQADEDRDSDAAALENTLGICLPWLMIVLQQEVSFDLVSTKLASMRTLLETIMYVPNISRTTKQAIRLATTLLSNVQNKQHPMRSTNDGAQNRDIELYTSAIKNIQAIEPPIRVQGLSELEILARRGSSLVSTSSVSLTAISLLQDHDSFVYLSAVKLLVTMAKEDPQSTLRILQEAYQDITEQSTLDVRLRIGEALQTIFEELGRSLPADPVVKVVKLLLFMSSRRVHRSKTESAEKNQIKPIHRVEKSQDDGSESDMESDEKMIERDVQTVLESWQGKSGEEDLRIRMSALTILSTIFEHTDFSTVATFVTPTLELVSGILDGEKGQENAIIRRAAVLTVLSMFKGIQEAGDALPLEKGITQDDVSLETVEDLFTKVAAEDDDDIVRGHAESLVQAIRDWKEETFARLLRGDTIRLGLGDENENVRLRGIDLDLDTQLDRNRSAIRKIEEIE